MAGGQPQASTVNDNNPTKKSVSVKPDGKYYIQLSEAAKPDSQKLLEGHGSCPNDNGAISSLWKGEAYPTQKSAVADLKAAKKDYPKAWVVNHVNCG